MVRELVKGNYPCKRFLLVNNEKRCSRSLVTSGSMITLEAAGRWLASYSQEGQEELKAQDPALFEKWDEQTGDRMTELVFIRRDMDKEQVMASLNQCLVQKKKKKNQFLLSQIRYHHSQ